MFQKATKDPGVDWSGVMVSVKIEGGFSHAGSVVPNSQSLSLVSNNYQPDARVLTHVNDRKGDQHIYSDPN